MASIATVLDNNSSIFVATGRAWSLSLVIGGTSRIGESTARAFIRNTDEARAMRIIERMAQTKPNSQITFIKSDVSLMRQVDDACGGAGTTKGRDETDEGIDKKLSFHYYSRMRFVTNLLPQLVKAGESSEQTLNNRPPLIVRTRLGRGFGIATKFVIYALLVLARPWEIPLAEGSERHLDAATSYHGSGFYRLSSIGSTYNQSKIMQAYHENRVRSIIWKHTLGVFAKAYGAHEADEP
ncbi:hypothetical protein BDV09DRAFT_184513 [Aspergillus tetrazonus]